jgi:DNA repair protein RadC
LSEPPHYLGHRQRLRERFLRHGLEGFQDYEVLELLLTLAIPRRDVKTQAKALIQRFGSIRRVLDASLGELEQVDGLGSVAPVALRVIRDVASLYLRQEAEAGRSLLEGDALPRMWRARIGALDHEVFEVAYLDSAYCLLRAGVERLEEGLPDRSNVYPRRVIEAALRRGAAALTLAHNHPNGDVTPSEADKLLTRALVLAAATVEVKILDHLIVSSDRTFSFRKEGLL